eukprot:gene5958-7421_t
MLIQLGHLESCARVFNANYINFELNSNIDIVERIYMMEPSKSISNPLNGFLEFFRYYYQHCDSMIKASFTFAKSMKPEPYDIAIIGIGLRFPGGSKTPNEFWDQMVNKFDGISKTPKERWSSTYHDQELISNEHGGFLKDEEWKNFDPLFFGISPKEAPSLDPQQRILMTILWEAFEDAHIKPSSLRGSDTGVFIGMMNLDYQRCQFRDMSQISPYTVTVKMNLDSEPTIPFKDFVQHQVFSRSDLSKRRVITAKDWKEFYSQKVPSIPFFSTITGTQLSEPGFYGAQYIYDNLRMPVLFTQALSNIFNYLEEHDCKNAVFLEIAPHPTLSFYVNKCRPAESTVSSITVSPLHKKKEESVQFKNSLATLYCNGINLNFACQFESTTSFKDSTSRIPRYQWENDQYWIEPLLSRKLKHEGPSTTLLGNQQGQVGLFPHNYEKGVKLDVDALQSLCSYATLSKAEVYSKLITLGLPYGPSFQRLESFSVGPNCSLSKLQVSPSSSLDNSFFNASVLDCALHGLIALTEGPQEVVFDRLENLKVYHKNIPAHQPEFLWVFAKIINQVGNSSHGSIQIMTQDGTLLVSIGKVKSTSLIRVKKPLPKYPTKELYSHQWQSKESPLPSPWATLSTLTSMTYEVNQLFSNDQFYQYSIRYLFNSLQSEFPLFNLDFILNKKLEPLEQMNFLSIDQKYSKLFLNLMDILKGMGSFSEESLSVPLSKLRSSIQDKFQQKYQNEILLLEKSIKSIVHLLKGIDSEYYSPSPSSPVNSPRELGSDASDSTSVSSDPSTPTTKSSNDKSDIDYLHQMILSSSKISNEQIDCLTSVVKQLVAPIVQEKRIFKVLQLGGNQYFLLDLVKKLLATVNGDKSNITVELTYSDSNDKFEQIKQSVNQLIGKSESNLSVKYRLINLEADFVESEGLLPTNYDIVVASYLLHTVPDVSYVLSQIQKVLSPKGHLLFIEPPKNTFYFDLVFGSFQNWWSFTDNDLRPSHCCLSPLEWTNLLTQNGFNKTCSSTGEFGDYTHNLPFVIHSQKDTIDSLPIVFPSVSVTASFDTFYLVIGSSDQKDTQQFRLFNEHAILYSNHVQILESSSITDEQLSKVTDQDIIVYLAGLESLQLNNYKTRTMEFTKINQHLLKQGLSTKLILLTSESQMGGSNYLGSSLIGTYRYFLEFPTLNIYSIDLLDEDARSTTTLTKILKLVESSVLGDREFVIKKDQQVLIQKIHKESHLLKSESYESDPSQMYMNLNSNLNFVFRAREQLAPQEIEIKVMATGINYKDNLFYRGLLPQEVFSKGDIYSPPFGLECAGYVSAVGSQVSKFKVGDQVVGFASHSLGSHVVTHQDRCVIKPSSIPFTVAASIPVVYATSYYSIFHIGAYCPDYESILIHSATGGVGLAALNLLKWKKTTGSIYATVGSREKEDYLLKEYGSFITDIYSSRDTFTIDLERASKYNSRVINDILTEVLNAIADGSLNPIPVQTFPAKDVKNAIEYINERKHIGKIVVDFQDFEQDIQLPSIQESPLYKIKKLNHCLENVQSTVLITGQTGIAIQILRWKIANSKISSVICLSRSKLKWEFQLLMNQIREQYGPDRIKFYFKSVDVSKIDQVRNAIQEIYVSDPTLAPIKSVYHFATVYEYILPEDITQQVIDNTHDPKAVGAINLHNLSLELDWKLDHFILFSSIASVLGGSKQMAYTSANYVLDALANYRTSQGLSAVSINWGALDAGGVVATDKSVSAFLQSQGILLVSLSKILGGLDGALQNKLSNFMVANFNTEQLLNNIPQMKRKMEHHLINLTSSKSNGGDNGSSSSGSGSSVQDKVVNSPAATSTAATVPVPVSKPSIVQTQVASQLPPSPPKQQPPKDSDSATPTTGGLKIIKDFSFNFSFPTQK